MTVYGKTPEGEFYEVPSEVCQCHHLPLGSFVCRAARDKAQILNVIDQWERYDVRAELENGRFPVKEIA